MAKFKVVITDREYDNIDNELRVLGRIDAEVLDYQYKNEDDILRVAGDADAIITQYARMPRTLVEQLDKCKVIARYATGYDRTDVQACTDNGIYVCNVPDYCTDEVSTHALALLLDLSRRVSAFNSWTHSGRWSHMPGSQHSLCDQVIGVIGFGSIAASFADKVRPLCSNIWVYSNHATDEELAEHGAVSKSLEEICREADYISIHCPLNERTDHMFNKDVFRQMKNTAAIINVARGGIVDEDDLIRALQSGQIGGAALDVMEPEPADPGNPLFQCDNVIITPHVAWLSVESQRVLQTTPAEDVVRALTGQVPHNLVNREVLAGQEIKSLKSANR